LRSTSEEIEVAWRAGERAQRIVAFARTDVLERAIEKFKPINPGTFESSTVAV
jgi:hypothetical protein